MARTTSASNEVGFTLLECQIGLIVLMFLVVGLARLAVAHERLVGDLGAWLGGDASYFVVAPADDLKRTLGGFATMSEGFVARGPDPAAGDQVVTILEVDRDLIPPACTALVLVEFGG